MRCGFPSLLSAHSDSEMCLLAAALKCIFCGIKERLFVFLLQEERAPRM